MKVETSTLIGDALDFAVCLAEGDEVGAKILRFQCASNYRKFSPSTDWAYGGPIVERERMNLDEPGSWSDARPDQWRARRKDDETGLYLFVGFGPEPLVAAMRCWVHSVFGDTIEIPDEILSRSKPCV